jgi:hypothetical protein
LIIAVPDFAKTVFDKTDPAENRGHKKERLEQESFHAGARIGNK